MLCAYAPANASDALTIQATVMDSGNVYATHPYSVELLRMMIRHHNRGETEADTRRAISDMALISEGHLPITIGNILFTARPALECHQLQQKQA